MSKHHVQSTKALKTCGLHSRIQQDIDAVQEHSKRMLKRSWGQIDVNEFKNEAKETLKQLNKYFQEVKGV